MVDPVNPDDSDALPPKENGALEEPPEPFDFSSSYTDNFPKILKGLNISLAVTSYQSQRLFFIRTDGESIDTNFKHFARPMGIYADQERLTLGTLTQVLEFKRNDSILKKIKNGELDNTDKMTQKVLEKDPELARKIQEKRKEELDTVKSADALYLARAALTTGMINIHDIAWGDEGLWVVNSTFSCLATLSPNHSFVARWKPPFITELVPEDRCHLNGMAMKDGRPKYVTTFNKFNSRDSWVNQDQHDGTLLDVDSGEMLLEGLIMPHSPRYYQGKVYVCNSGCGTILQFDPATREVLEIIKLPGFPRGLNFAGPLMFVGLSQTRPSETRQPLPINKEYEKTVSGVWIFNLEDHTEVGHLQFSGDVAQIYDIAVIPQSIHPELLNTSDSLIRHTFDFQESL
ncbi:MAG: TIGR03032 family protein [Proteobacteria bacterium]|nr:TIGR03032 family protein [Pseudomonadota bacterium]MBU1060197.1 TIGR03032 family protein [Pseudomonadota bacterium]